MEAQKILLSLILPPGIFMVALFAVASISLASRRFLSAALSALVLLFAWAISIPPVTDWMILRLSGSAAAEDCFPSGWEKSDVIIVLGGGVHYPGCDINGSTILTGDSAIRLLTAARIHFKNRAPVIASGGKVLYHLPAEAYVMGVYLRDLGVKSETIIIEDRSKDTEENARFSVRICRERGFRRPIVVTSAYHINRAEYEFKKNGIKVIPMPAGYRPLSKKDYRWSDYLPGDFAVARTVIKEAGARFMAGLRD